MFGYGFEPEDNRSFFARLLDSATGGGYTAEAGQVDWMLEQADRKIHPWRYPQQSALPININVIMGESMGLPAQERSTSTLTWLALALGAVFICFLATFFLATISLGAGVTQLPELPAKNGSSFPIPTDNVTFAGVYGRPGGWGTLSKASSPEQAIQMAKDLATSVDQWNGAKTAVPLVNPCVEMQGGSWMDDQYVRSLVQQAGQEGTVVMLDVQDISAAKQAIDKYLADNVWLDIDVEWAGCGDCDINEIAEYYFAAREAKGFNSMGLIGFYLFRQESAINSANVKREYSGGLVIPVFDGHGGKDLKVQKTRDILGAYSPPWGIMSFYYRFQGGQYGDPGLGEQDYFGAFEAETLLFMRQ